MQWLGAIAAIGFAFLCYKAWDVASHVRPRFWLEYWRQPELAFVMMTRDPGFKVLDSEPDEAPEMAGWIGPVVMKAYGYRFAVYVDEAQHPAALDRIASGLVEHRGRGRIHC